jgi:hypothetical protein
MERLDVLLNLIDGVGIEKLAFDPARPLSSTLPPAMTILTKRGEPIRRRSSGRIKFPAASASSQRKPISTTTTPNSADL